MAYYERIEKTTQFENWMLIETSEKKGPKYCQKKKNNTHIIWVNFECISFWLSVKTFTHNVKMCVEATGHIITQHTFWDLTIVCTSIDGWLDLTDALPLLHIKHKIQTTRKHTTSHWLNEWNPNSLNGTSYMLHANFLTPFYLLTSCAV